MTVARADPFERAPAFVPPGRDAASGFAVQRLQDILDVFFHGARAAIKKLGDLAVAFARRDPAQDLSLPQSQRRQRRKRDRLQGATGQAGVNLGSDGGHGGLPFITREARRPQSV
jgi:hypothetical protein